MKPVTLVVLSKFSDIFSAFVSSADKFLPGIPRIVVRDGNGIRELDGWQMIQGPEVFSMSANANLGLRAAPADHDVIYCGDDIEFTQPDTIQRLQEIAYAHENLGILSPRIIKSNGELAVNNVTQADPSPARDITFTEELCFPCVYIKRAVFNAIGFLAESFGTDYGYDDGEFCVRARRAGFLLGVTPRVTVLHEHPCATFQRNHGENWTRVQIEQMQRNRKIYEELCADS